MAPRGINKKTMTRHIIIKLLKTKVKEKNLKSSQKKKKHIIHWGMIQIIQDQLYNLWVSMHNENIEPIVQNDQEFQRQSQQKMQPSTEPF